MNAVCNICSSTVYPFSTARLLKIYDVTYFKCRNCGFVQTEEPYWLEEAHSRAINLNDVGLVDRNIRLARTSQAVISMFFKPTAKFIDYGGGYGLFVRLMRDVGYDFYRHDKYCENLFAQYFEADLDEGSEYELLTAFEVFEHLAKPLEGVEQMLSFSKNILFTTEILPAHNPKPGEWWYYIPDYGQHVSFFTVQSLLALAGKFSLNFYTNGTSVHLLSTKKISQLFFKLICRHRMTSAINRIRKRPSLIPADYEKITGKEIL
jgi:hypothetical protein